MLPNAQVMAPVGVQRPEVKVGVLLVHRVGALRSGAPGPGGGSAAGGGETDETTAQGSRGRPSHAALQSRPLSLQPPPPVRAPHLQQERFQN